MINPVDRRSVLFTVKPVKLKSSMERRPALISSDNEAILFVVRSEIETISLPLPSWVI